MALKTPLNWRRRGRLTGLALLLASTLFANTNALARTGAQALAPEQGQLDFTAAQVAARAHLGQFLSAALDGNGQVYRDAALRIALSDGRGKTRLVWITPFRQDNSRFTGMPQGAPAALTGTELQFDRAQIVDWSLSAPDGRLYGNFATRLFLQTLPADQGREIAAILAETPTPKEWSH